MKKQLKRWASASHAKNMLKDDSGAALVEYGLLVGLIAVVCITAVTALGGTIRNLFCDVVTGITTQVPGVGAGVGCP